MCNVELKAQQQQKKESSSEIWRLLDKGRQRTTETRKKVWGRGGEELGYGKPEDTCGYSHITSSASLYMFILIMAHPPRLLCVTSSPCSQDNCPLKAIMSSFILKKKKNKQTNSRSPYPLTVTTSRVKRTQKNKRTEKKKWACAERERERDTQTHTQNQRVISPQWVS